MRRFQLALGVVLSIAIANGTEAASTNLIVNPRFHRDLEGWRLLDPTTTSATYNTFDTRAAEDSGSALVSAIHPVPFEPAALRSTCFPVTAGKHYEWSAEVFVSGFQTERGSAQAGLRFSSDSACANQMSAIYYNDGTSTTGTLVELSGKGPAPLGAVAAELLLSPVKGTSGGTLSAYFDNASVVELGCGGLESLTMLCLQGGRFTVTADWQTGSANGRAGAVQLTSDSGYFWFFDPANVEVVVKVLNACVDPFERFWSFSAGLTNVQVDVTVVDTQTGSTNVYHNPLGTEFQPKLDTNAFATCP